MDKRLKTLTFDTDDRTDAIIALVAAMRPLGGMPKPEAEGRPVRLGGSPTYLAEAMSLWADGGSAYLAGDIVASINCNGVKLPDGAVEFAAVEFGNNEIKIRTPTMPGSAATIGISRDRLGGIIPAYSVTVEFERGSIDRASAILAAFPGFVAELAEPEGSRRLQLSLSDVGTAARAWAAAAGSAGSPVPQLVAERLIGGSTIVDAVVGAGVTAKRNHDEDVEAGWTGPAPRGLHVHMRGGYADRIEWRGETHECTLSSPATTAPVKRWLVSIEASGPLSESRRCRAAVATAWRWREPEEEAEIARAAREIGLDLTAVDAAADAEATIDERGARP